MNLPQPTITGLLDGSITRVFEVMEPQPDGFEQWALETPAPYIRKGMRNFRLPNPFGEPGTIHTIGGQQFVVVESGAKQVHEMNQKMAMQATTRQTIVDFNIWISGLGTDTWLWTAELRRKDEDE